MRDLLESDQQQRSSQAKSGLNSPTRRLLLAGGAGLLASQVTAPSWALNMPQTADEFWIRPRTLNLRHVKGERLVSTYWSDGQIIRSAYEEISWFMRDRVAHEAVYMHPVLLDILYGVNGWLTYFGIKEPIVLTSAYRNARRNNRIEGAARDGPHTKGEAADGVIPGVSTKQVATFGKWLGGGGVGWYPDKGFTHLDCGRLRSWRG